MGVLDRHVCSFGDEFADDAGTEARAATCDDGSFVGKAGGHVVRVDSALVA